jgi:8-oxo-dGTP pyrophosphatase MutT (NUDIX family)
MSRPEDATERVFRPDVTVATVIPRDGRLLVVEERVRGALVLNQPAGHLEPDESLLDAAVRETLEETGWHVRLSHLIGIYRWTAPDGSAFLRVGFAGQALEHDPTRELDDGIERALWMTPAELDSAHDRARSPLVLALVHDWLAGARLPLSAVREWV